MFLRIGCATATRRNPFAEKDYFFASWLRHCRPRAGRCETPPAGCCASGENERNKPGEKASFLHRLFLRFHSARGLSFRFPSNMRKPEWINHALHRRAGAGPMALPWGYGGRGAPCSAVPHLTRGKTFGKVDFCIAKWVQEGEEPLKNIPFPHHSNCIMPRRLYNVQST